MSETEYAESDTENEGDAGAANTAPQNASPGMGDIFNRIDTKNEIKIGTIFYALVGVGLGLGVLLADAFEEGIFAEGTLLSGIILAPALAVLIAQRQSNELGDLPDNLAFGTAAVTAIAGTVALGLLLWLFGEITFDLWLDLGDALLPVIGIGIGAAAVGVGMIWVMRNLIDDE